MNDNIILFGNLTILLLFSFFFVIEIMNACIFSFAPWEGFLIPTMKELGSQLIKALNFIELESILKEQTKDGLGVVNIKHVLLLPSTKEALVELW